MALRERFVGDMWSAIASAMRQSKQALDADLAQAIRRLWSMDGDNERLRRWDPGTLGPASEAVDGMDPELRRLYEGVATAGSWATWMGVFSRSWLANPQQRQATAGCTATASMTAKTAGDY